MKRLYWLLLTLALVAGVASLMLFGLSQQAISKQADQDIKQGFLLTCHSQGLSIAEFETKRDVEHGDKAGADCFIILI